MHTYAYVYTQAHMSADQCVLYCVFCITMIVIIYAEDPMATYEKILGNKMTLPDFFSKVSSNDVYKL
jgi:hypothetical protein